MPNTYRPPAPPPGYVRAVRMIWFIGIIGVLLMATLFVAVDINLGGLFGASPTLADLQRPRQARATDVYSADGVLVGRYYRENRIPIKSYQELSPWLVKALLATEDIRFEEHSGIDPVATLSVMGSVLRGSGRGGSTVSQQLAKNLYKTRRSQSSRGPLAKVPGLATPIAKMKEWLTAVKLEQSYTKAEIMTMYFNTVDFGSNAYGIKTAAKTFFSTTPDQLGPEQAALLIGMLKATTSYNPRRNPDRARARRNVVLGQMAKYGYLSDEEVARLSRLPIRLRTTPEEHADGPLDYYNQYLTQVLNAWGDRTDHDIYADGLRIILSIDTRFQEYAKQAVWEHMSELQARFDRHWAGKPPWRDESGAEINGFLDYHIKRSGHYRQAVQRYGGRQDSIEAYLNRKRPMQVFAWRDQAPTTVERIMSPLDSLAHYKRLLHAGFMCLDPLTGHTKAWVGGLDYGQFMYDHVRQSRRQPGSTFKPFVYAAAIDARGMSPCDKIQDRSVSVPYQEMEGGQLVDKMYTFRNATGVFSGMNMTLRYGMGRSINTIAVQLQEKVGRPTVIDYARRMGIRDSLKPFPSLALGANDVSLYDMVGAYGTFLNRGVWTEPMIVQRIEDANGKILAEFTPLRQKALSEESAWLMLYMLRGTIEEPQGTAQNLWTFNLFRGNQLGGKTGTSNNQSDGWFIGVSKDLVAGTWVGAEERSVHFRTLRTGEGSKTALPIYGLFMEKVYQDPSLGIRMGNYPKPFTKIRRNYICPMYIPRPKADSTEGGGAGPSPSDTLHL